ncbi:ABC transporter ATP-binding protein [Geomicrobium sediminis]|uniref:ABC-2 type transport system ATP-binding protein n=1 Tax=Geomicrobium sediminis TaxID=1347788 RepID=A0ABS2PGV6_9BACL|nr:ABC transporter ATP-binding protein [Geomicrobium sediminis]MBM7634571.1 ABC-2 type transport system ATP-binding protein [Geomicrobium sediminis]
MITIDQVSKSYGKKQVIKNVSLSIPEGSCFGLVGPNGAGKSTLLKLITMILSADHGEITIAGESTKRNSAKIKQQLGYVPQEICLEETLTVEDNLKFFSQVYNVPSSIQKERIDHVLKTIQLEDRKKTIVKQLSGGMQRRLNIGCTLLHDPLLLIMDEPTVGVDPNSRNEIYNVVKTLIKSNKTVIYSSHYMEEIEKLCDLVCFLNQGEVIDMNSPQTIKQKNTTKAVEVSIKTSDLKHFQHLGEPKESKNGYVFPSDDPLRLIHQLTATMKEHRIDVHHLQMVTPSLEDIYLQKTGQSLSEEGQS